MKYMGFSIG
ncbi:hypothetical protein PENSTE_c043G05483 [Penicillium steckii]|uniref:Uncharacterized protein n=1 Tax=Penicillium steckii TaxID=303698 RepID=A0A1V6SJG5_9EURO|nr:hypothetical protein PENSTE_c043G05483 [Penicillium steckii]